MKDQPIATIKELVLWAISDDYECFERVVEDVTAWSTEHDITVNAVSTRSKR